MADEELDLEETPSEENINKTEKRIKDLSEKVKLTSEERDEKAALIEKLEKEKANSQKEVEFYKGFSNVASKYTSANEFQDKIKEKFDAGYDLEDATIAILAKEGKYAPSAPESKPKESPAGGSANTTLKSGGEKSPHEMTQDERRAALQEAESKGDLSVS